MMPHKPPETILELVRAFMALTALVIAVFDFFLLFVYGPEATISWTIRDISSKHPAVIPIAAFAMGALFYHLFIDRK